MTENTAKRLYAAARRLGMTGKNCDRDERVSLRKNYSGRGMYGRSTFALDVPGSGVLLRLVASARVERADRENFAREVGNLATDSMGLGIVVY